MLCRVVGALAGLIQRRVLLSTGVTTSGRSTNALQEQLSAATALSPAVSVTKVLSPWTMPGVPTRGTLPPTSITSTARQLNAATSFLHHIMRSLQSHKQTHKSIVRLSAKHTRPCPAPVAVRGRQRGSCGTPVGAPTAQELQRGPTTKSCARNDVRPDEPPGRPDVRSPPIPPRLALSWPPLHRSYLPGRTQSQEPLCSLGYLYILLHAPSPTRAELSVLVDNRSIHPPLSEPPYLDLESNPSLCLK